MADSDKILSFPGSHRPATAAKAAAAKAEAGKAGAVRTGTGQAGPAKADAPAPAGAVDAEQIKAIQLAQSGMGFVMIALKPTAGGADFFTAVHGDATELRGAQDHLSGVIERAFARKGI